MQCAGKVGSGGATANCSTDPCQVGQHCDSTTLTCVCDNRCTAAGPICDPSGSGQIGTCTLDETTGCYAITDLAACPVPAETCSAGAFACVGPSELMGWELDETNTGLKGDYSALSELTDLTGIGYVYGSLAITASNITISDKLISHWIEITGTNVTFLRCLVKPPSVNTGSPLIGGSDYNFIDSELDASLISASGVAAGLSLAGGGNILRSNLHHMSTGIQLYNSVGKTMLVENNYVNGVRYVSPAHIDGLTIRQATGTSVTIRNNRLSIDQPCTAAIFYQAQSYIDNVITEGNLVESPDYNLVLDYNTAGYGNNMQVINNRFHNFAVSGGPAYGYMSYSGSGWSVWSENYKYDPNAEDVKGEAIVY